MSAQNYNTYEQVQSLVIWEQRFKLTSDTPNWRQRRNWYIQICQKQKEGKFSVINCYRMGNQSCFLQMFKWWAAELKHPIGSYSDLKTYSAADGAPAEKWRPPQTRDGHPKWHWERPGTVFLLAWAGAGRRYSPVGGRELPPPGAKAWSPSQLTLDGDKEKTWKSSGIEDEVIFQCRTSEGKVRTEADQSRVASWGPEEKQSTQGRRQCSITPSSPFHLMYLLLYPQDSVS